MCGGAVHLFRMLAQSGSCQTQPRNLTIPRVVLSCNCSGAQLLHNSASTRLRNLARLCIAGEPVALEWVRVARSLESQDVQASSGVSVPLGRSIANLHPERHMPTELRSQAWERLVP